MNVNVGLLSGKVGIAVSGGMDSMALLHWCKTNCRVFNFTPVAVNLDHGIRGEASARDSLFVKDYCQKHNIPLIRRAVNVPEEYPAGSLENNARKARYAFFNELIQTGQVDLIATAHHADDQAETVLFNLFRGSGPQGIRGIAQKKDKIVRPLLTVSKEEIINYVTQNNIPYVEDHTNQDTSYSRNYIRHALLPLIKERFVGAVKNISSYARLASLDQEYLLAASPEPQNTNDGLYFPANYINLPYPLLSRSVIKGLNALGVTKDIEKVHIDNFISLYELPPSSQIDLKGNIIATKLRDGGILMQSAQKQPAQFVIPFKEGAIFTSSGILTITLQKSAPKDLKDGSALYIDADILPKDCVIRNRRDGDKIALFSGVGATTLKKLFQSKNIDTRLRPALPVIAKDGEVYVIAGVEISGKVKVNGNTKNIYKITWEQK